MNIDFNNLETYINNFINFNKYSIIYIGAGTFYFNNDKISDRDYKNNQQFPPFLQDFKLKNLNIPILIILIDPEFNLNILPHIIQSSGQFYSNSWNITKESNLYHSNLDIDVIAISDIVSWNNNFQNIKFNFENFLINLCHNLSNNDVNTLLFYHEFTGTNVILLENLIKKKLKNFDNNKICIDITRGADMSCYFDLSNPEFYPIVKYDEIDKTIKYINTNQLTNEIKMKILNKYKKITIESKNKFNLREIETDLILYFQIIKLDKIIFDNVSTCILPLIRYLFVCENITNINNTWCINHINQLKFLNDYLNNNYNYKNYLEIFNKIECIEEDINLIYSIKLNNQNYNEQIVIISFIKSKENIIDKLFDILKNIHFDILIKYSINLLNIDNFFEGLKKESNKYKLITIYKNFISNINF